MKKPLFAVLTTAFLFCSFVSMYAGDDGNDDDKRIVINPVKDQTAHKHNRVPALVPIEAYYDSFMSSVFISFTKNIGDADVVVFNSNNGETVETTVNAYYAPAVISVSGAEGHYTLYITLSSGAEYCGEFEI